MAERLTTLSRLYLQGNYDGRATYRRICEMADSDDARTGERVSAPVLSEMLRAVLVEASGIEERRWDGFPSDVLRAAIDQVDTLGLARELLSDDR